MPSSLKEWNAIIIYDVKLEIYVVDDIKLVDGVI